MSAPQKRAPYVLVVDPGCGLAIIVAVLIGIVVATVLLIRMW